MGIEVTLRLTSIEAYVRRKHGGMRDLGVDELRILDRYAEQIVDDIQGAWPVDTSTSRDAFTYSIEGRERVAIIIENDTDYAEYVYRAGEDPDTPLYTTLIPETWDAWRGPLTSELRAAIDSTEALIASEKARPGGLSVRRILAGQRPPVQVLRPGRVA